jgi:hypothetical protein
MDTKRSTSTPTTARRRAPSVGDGDTFSFGRPWRPRRWPYAVMASAVAVSMVAASAVNHGVAPARGVALRLVSDQTVRPASPLRRHVQLGHFGGVQERAVWVTTPAGAGVAPAPGFVPSTAGGASAGQGPSGTAGTGSASSGQAPASTSTGTALAPVVGAPVAPAALGIPMASTSTSPSPSPSPSPSDSPSVSPSASGTAGGFLAAWVADCDVSDPGTTSGTAAWNVYWQHHASPSGYGFPVDQMNYPCGPDWIIIPGSDPYTPPVWNGTVAPFTPPTNMPGGQMFIAADDASASQLAAELGAAGVPITTSGQLLAYGADGAPVYTSDWWTLNPAIKNKAASILFKHDSTPHPMWRTDSYHWGYGNIGVGLPT